MIFLSIVSGTSTDGLTMALIELEGTGLDTKFKIISDQTFPYDSVMKENLLKIASGKPVTMEFVSRVHWDLGRLIERDAEIFDGSFDVIAYSGHTAFHGPTIGDLESGTYQLGEISVLAAKTGKTVVQGFRTSDMAFGGLGAPLIAVADYFVLKNPGTLAINIGGIANITYIGKNFLLGFDTGPGNMLIDQASRKLFGEDLDRNGTHASGGVVNEKMLNYLLEDQYLKIKPPKTSGREYFGEKYLDDLLFEFKKLNRQDFMRTLTRFTSAALFDQTEKFINGKVEKIFVGGGGTLNPVIMSDLNELYASKISTFSEVGIDDMSRECLGFAILANQTLHMKPGRLTSLSPLQGNVLGKIIPGKNFAALMSKILL